MPVGANPSCYICNHLLLKNDLAIVIITHTKESHKEYVSDKIIRHTTIAHKTYILCHSCIRKKQARSIYGLDNLAEKFIVTIVDTLPPNCHVINEHQMPFMSEGKMDTFTAATSECKSDSVQDRTRFAGRIESSQMVSLPPFEEIEYNQPLTDSEIDSILTSKPVPKDFDILDHLFATNKPIGIGYEQQKRITNSSKLGKGVEVIK
jgi:hypothetical protein